MSIQVAVLGEELYTSLSNRLPSTVVRPPSVRSSGGLRSNETLSLVVQSSHSSTSALSFITPFCLLSYIRSLRGLPPEWSVTTSISFELSSYSTL